MVQIPSLLREKIHWKPIRDRIFPLLNHLLMIYAANTQWADLAQTCLNCYEL